MTMGERREDTAQQSKALAERIVARVRQPLIIVDAELRVVAVNRSFTQVFQPSRQAEGALLYDLGEGFWDSPQLRERLAEVPSANAELECELECEVEQDIPGLARRTLVLKMRRGRGEDEHPLILLGIEDVTERRRVEQQIKAAEAKYHDLYENAPDMFASVDTGTGATKECNQTLATALGYTKEEIIGRPIFDLYHPDCKDDVEKAWQSFVETGEMHNAELLLQRKDGSKIDVILNVSAVRDEQGKILYGRSAWHDITERKRIEQELRASRTAALNMMEDAQTARQTAEQAVEEARESEAKYRSLVENATYGIYRSTVDGKFEAVNRALVEMLGYASQEELLPVHLADLYFDSDERTRLHEKYQGVEGVTGDEVQWKRRNGSPITVRLNGRKIRDARGEVTAYEVIAEDITERRVLEEQLRQSQKLEALGRLAGGVAHDFNNILTIVLGESAMALRDLPDHHPLRDPLQGIHDAGTRAEGLTRQLLAFSRKQIVEPVVFDVNKLVMGVDKMLRRLIGEDIELITRTASDPVMVTADHGQIEQVLLNLAVNARDAMTEGGKLVIETGVLVLDEGYADSHAEVGADDYALISVSDTGMGMTDDVKAQLFDPFFTTKGSEHGSGLGLAVCYGIVKQLGGHIAVDSEPGLGTTMKVYLPRAVEAAAAPVAPVEETVPRGDETILLVEDEEAVRRMGMRILLAQGYQVLEAGDGEEALRVLEGYDDHVQLLLCDVVLPKVGGRVVADRVRELRPDIKVLFVSGYTDDVILKQRLLARDWALLQKPFTPMSLASKVREVLDA